MVDGITDIEYVNALRYILPAAFLSVFKWTDSEVGTFSALAYTVHRSSHVKILIINKCASVILRRYQPVVLLNTYGTHAYM